MRPQPDLPRRVVGGRRKRGRKNRERKPGRGRVVAIVVWSSCSSSPISLRGIAGFYTDYLWFDSLGLERRSGAACLGAKLSLSIIFTLLFFLICYRNLIIADRLAPAFPPTGPEDDLIERYHELIGHRTRLVRIGVSALFAVIVGREHGVALERVDPLHPPRRTSGSRTPRSTPTSGSTSSSCRSSRRSSVGCSPRSSSSSC